jgi:surfactin family lipopeptide synthetase A
VVALLLIYLCLQATTLLTNDKEISPTHDFPLVVCLEKGCLKIKYDTDALDSGIIPRLCSCMETVLAYMESHPDALVRNVPLIDQAAANGEIISSLMGPLCESRLSDPLVHEEFEKKAASNPDDVCLVYEGVTMNYSEVNQRANAVAYALLKRGLKNGDLVGILLERSFDLVIGILGVLKAGGGYVPVRSI